MELGLILIYEYSISRCVNGCDDGDLTFDYLNDIQFTDGTILGNNDVYVICHPSSDTEIIDQCDQEHYIFK